MLHRRRASVAKLHVLNLISNEALITEDIPARRFNGNLNWFVWRHTAVCVKLVTLAARELKTCFT